MKKETFKQETGFTLIELLVAFVLFGFLMSLLYGSFTFANRVMLRTSQNNNQAFDIFQTQTFLQELLDNCYPANNAFVGSQQNVTFLAPLNRQGIAQGLYKINLQQVRNRDAFDLTLSWEAIHQESVQGKYFKGSLVLLENIERMEFAYLDDGSSQTQEIWTSGWDKEGDLPTHIRLKLVNGSKEYQWPEQIIKIQVTHNVDCMYDPVSRRCI